MDHSRIALRKPLLGAKSLAFVVHKSNSMDKERLLQRWARTFTQINLKPRSMATDLLRFERSQAQGARLLIIIFQWRHDMTALIALAISIGGLAVVATWLFLNPLAALDMQIWQAFIAWACFFHCGGKVEGLQKTALCMSLGAVIGALSVVLAGQLGALGGLAAPVAVGIGAAVAVLAAHVGILSTIPATVYGFAAVAGLILMKGAPPLNAIVPTIGSIILGAIFGLLSEMISGKLTKA
jgi:hypothetical protein